MRKRKLFRLVLVGTACVLSTACATTSYSRSGVATLPPGVKGKAGSNASIEVEGLRIRVESHDYAKKHEAIPPLRLRLAFDLRELGYSFDPAQVVLRDATGRTWSPADFESRYHPLAPGSSFTLVFDATVTRDTRLELELGGLARGRRRLDPVRLTFARHDGRSYDRIYWLEAIGTVLLAPLALAGGGM